VEALADAGVTRLVDTSSGAGRWFRVDWLHCLRPTMEVKGTVRLAGPKKKR
jgi:hypothetical protein